MIRTLIMVAVAGFVVAVASVMGAAAITGPEAIAHGAWSWGPGGWGRGADAADEGSSAAPTQATRQIAWNGADTLTVDIPADVTVRRAPGAASLSVTGPARAVERVRIEGGEIRYASGDDDQPRLQLTAQAPTLSRVILRHRGEVAWEEGPVRSQPSAKP